MGKNINGDYISRFKLYCDGEPLRVTAVVSSSGPKVYLFIKFGELLRGGHSDVGDIEELVDTAILDLLDNGYPIDLIRYRCRVIAEFDQLMAHAREFT